MVKTTKLIGYKSFDKNWKCQYKQYEVGKSYIHEGDLVVDPFAGSGTSLLAAQNLNREYLGAEREEKYRQIISNRLAPNPVSESEEK